MTFNFFKDISSTEICTHVLYQYLYWSSYTEVIILYDVLYAFHVTESA